MTEQTGLEAVNHILKDWLIYDLEKTTDGYLAIAQYALPVWYCPVCGVINPRLIKYGKKKQTLRLALTWLQVCTIRQRYHCSECGSTFWEPIFYQS